MSGWVHTFAFSTLLRIEVAKVFDIPWVAYVGAIFSLQAVGSWNHDPADDEGSFLGGG